MDQCPKVAFQIVRLLDLVSATQHIRIVECSVDFVVVLLILCL